MIVSRDKNFPVPIGMVFKNQRLTFKNEKYTNVTLMVLREATYEEYKEQCREEGTISDYKTPENFL